MKLRRSGTALSSVVLRDARRHLAEARFDEAERLCRLLLTRNPADPEAWLIVGQVRSGQRRCSDAEAVLAHACGLCPEFAGLHAALGQLYLELNRFGDAIGPIENCVLLDATASEQRATLVALYGTRAFATFSERSKVAMTICLADPALTHSLMRRAWLSLLRLDPEEALTLELLDAPDYDSFCRLATDDRLSSWEASAFIVLGLRRFLVAEPMFERGLTLARAWFLRHGDSAERHLALVCTLARYCFLTEYAFVCDVDSSELPTRPRTPGEVARLACYRSLADYPDAASFRELSEDPSYRDLIDVTVREPIEERAIAERVVQLASIADAVSVLVRQQYEENPYPRWTTVGSGGAVPRDVAQLARGKSILVAGCGTGREAIDAALIFPAARVEAIDLSRMSLAYATRKAAELRVSNVFFRQADILDVARLESSFDLIVCSGVLHHMRDPVAGLRALVAVLAPGGVLKIALYSTLARTAFSAAREWARGAGFVPTPQGIRDFRAAILARPDSDPIRQRLTESYDFYSVSQCRDLVFHIEEHTFSLPELASIIGELGLSILQLEARGPRDLEAYRAKFPADSAAVDLANWDILERENPSMFSKMYVLWLCRRDGAKASVEWIRRTGRM
ncbi:MAG TPA: methyltransferase domain-containing protein [Polyangiaceae bacterium]|jgi:SAM-dependent methyltransferase|nr:methyltransferase domain-containing protein [Polyangiaceae bacterium]